MIINSISIFAVFLLAVTSLSIFLLESWRWRIIALALQYLAVFWLISLLWSIGMAAVNLVVGWMVCAVLGASQPEEKFVFSGLTSASTIFKVVVTAFVWVIVYSLAPSVADYISTGMVILWGSLLLIAMSLVQMGLHMDEKTTIIGVLTLLSGFELLYAALESSILVAGLLALINMSLALIGTYLLTVSTREVEDSK